MYVFLSCICTFRYFTADFTEYIINTNADSAETSSWTPSEHYFSELLQRLVKGTEYVIDLQSP